MKTIIINRDFQDKNQSLGVAYVKNEKGEILFKSESIERGWQDNQNNISCYPEGAYMVVLEYSPKFKRDLWEIKGVPNRSECKFHAANFASQLNGCTALGERRLDINNDGYFDISNSADTMLKFHDALSGEIEAILIVKNI